MYYTKRMKKETTKDKVDRYIRISQTPLGSKYQPIVQEYRMGSLSDSEFCFVCDCIYAQEWRTWFLPIKDVLDEAKKNESTKLQQIPSQDGSMGIQ